MNVNVFKNWIKKFGRSENGLRSLVENFYHERNVHIPVKNLEVRVYVAEEYVPRVIGRGGYIARELKKKVGCDFLKVVPAPKPGHPPENGEGASYEYEDFYRERRPNEHKRWTEEEEQKLTSFWKKGLGIGNIAKRLGRTPHSISCRLEKLGLPGDDPGSFTRTEDFLITKYHRKDKMSIDKISVLIRRNKKEVRQRMIHLGLIQNENKIPNKNTDSVYAELGKKFSDDNAENKFKFYKSERR